MTRHALRIRAKSKVTILAASVVSGILLYLFVSLYMATPKEVKAAGTETLSTGSYIVNMGITPQTVNNALKPYGMVYDLIVNYSVPVKWIIEPTKVKDGTDFTYSATAYKGGPFILPAEYLTTAVKARITYWNGQGVSGTYTTSPVTVPVYGTLTNFPKSIIDDASGNSNIIVAYFDNAMIPSSAYTIGMASTTTACTDLWINPHGDPDWDTHGYLYDLATTYHSNIWCQCHCVSVMEGVKNPSAPFQQLNYLTTNGLKCYSNNKCGPVTENHAGNSTAPYTYYYDTDPVMQFMGTMSGATNGGSEKWYIPQSTGAWRANTKLLVKTSDGSAGKEGVLMVYGPAYGNAANGLVMYTGGHDIDGNGTTAEKVAAQRAFFNFILLTAVTKQVKFTSFSTPSTVNSQATVAVSATVSSGTPAYTYQWTSTVGGTFANPNSASTTFTSPYTNTPLTGSLICTVTDACSRKNFASNPVTVPASTLPIELKTFSGFYQDHKITLSWITASEVNNDYFEILRSNDGKNFIPIGSVRGTGNSTIEVGYNFLDRDVPENQEVLYYQLKQYDYNGQSQLFDAIAVEINENYLGVYEVMPNPFMSSVRLDYYSSQPQNVTVTLVNSTGKIMQTKVIECPRGSTPIDLNNLDGLPAGVYFIILSDDKKQKLTRIVKL